MSILGLGRATFKEMVIDPKKVESFSYGLADEIIDGFRMVVEGWNRRNDDSSHSTELKYQFEMALMQRSLTHPQDKFSFFLKSDSQPGSTIMRAFIDHEVIISSISVLLRRPCQKFLDLSP